MIPGPTFAQQLANIHMACSMTVFIPKNLTLREVFSTFSCMRPYTAGGGNERSRRFDRTLFSRCFDTSATIFDQSTVS